MMDISEEIKSERCRLSDDKVSDMAGNNDPVRWLRENQKSIDSINQWVDEHGSFSEYQRSF